MVDQEDERSAQRRPRVLIAGAGEPRIEDVCEALTRRGIEPILVTGALDEAIRGERPNLVLLVGDASSDDGARGIDDARRGGPTPVVVATDPEPLDRRLAPFQYGARGIVVRRNDPDEMAGEIHHLLAENARRTAERARTARTPSELDELVGLGSRELRLSRTPHEGVSRIDALEELEARVASSDGLEHAAITDASSPVERRSGSLADWDEDLQTQRQSHDDVARWRRLSAADRTLLRTPEVMVAWSEPGEGLSSSEVTRPAVPLPADAVSVDTSLEIVHSRYERPTAERPIPELALERERAIARAISGRDAPLDMSGTLRDPIDDEWDAPTAQHDDVLAKVEAARGRELERARDEGDARRTSDVEEAGAASMARERISPSPELADDEPRPSSSAVASAAPGSVVSPRAPSSRASGAPSARPRSISPLPLSAPTLSATGERISSSSLLALAPPSRPPIEDRASTLRAQAMPRPRASVVPALILLGVTITVVGALVAGRFLQPGARSDEVSVARSAEPPARPSDDEAPAQPSVIEASSVAPAASPPDVDAHAAHTSPVGPAAPPPDDEAHAAPSAITASTAAATPTAAAEPSARTGPLSANPAPREANATDRDRSDALVREAAEAAERGDSVAARALLDRANAADPNNPHALIALALASLDSGDAAAAVRFAERAVAVRRRRAAYQVVLGDAHERAGDHARAVAAWRAALELEPHHAAARARLSR